MINNLDQFTISLEDIIKNSKNIYIIGRDADKLKQK